MIFENVRWGENKDTGILPIKATAGSAGYDFSSPKDVEINPGEKKIIWTGIKAGITKDYVLLVYIRSSMAIKRNLILANGTGVIDSDYYENKDNDGNIGICLYNYGNEKEKIKRGDRIAQGVVVKILNDSMEYVSDSKRSGGIGSTGR